MYKNYKFKIIFSILGTKLFLFPLKIEGNVNSFSTKASKIKGKELPTLNNSFKDKSGPVKNFNLFKSSRGPADVLAKGKVLLETDLGDSSVSSLKEMQYVVKRGDTLAKIAKRWGVSINILKFYNPNLRATALTAGQKIKIPSKNGIYYKVQRNDTLRKIANKYKISIDSITAYNGGVGIKDIKAGTRLFIPNPKLNMGLLVKKAPMSVSEYIKNPVMAEGVDGDLGEFMWPIKWLGVTSHFGNRIHPFKKRKAPHRGIDLKAVVGTPVLAPMDGTVITVGRKGAAGNIIEIRHNNGFSTRFFHLSKIDVNAGDFVKMGDKIGETGNTGRSTGPHLHMEVKDSKGNWINPELLRGKINTKS